MGFLLPTAHTERHHRAAPCFPARHPRERKNLSFSYKKNELNSVRLELEDTRETLKAVTARRADIEEELVARGKTKGYMAKVQSGVLVKDFFARCL